MTAAHTLAQEYGPGLTCQALSLSRATFYRSLAVPVGQPLSGSDPSALTPPACRVPGRALSLAERQRVLDTLHSERFVDKAPTQIFAQLLDEGTYLCSVSTLYRLLRQEHEVQERRAQRRHVAYQKPELLATAPNQLWSWDITKLLGPCKWTYYYLYVVIDVFSRYVVGWLLAPCESALLAEQLLQECCFTQGIVAGQLTIHADRGSSMTSKTVAFLLCDLGVTKTHSRPHVSNDNPFSESHFKTLKYQPEFPERFASIEGARHFCQGFFPWYNQEHRHSSLALLTPEMVHYGRSEQVLAERQSALTAAYGQHPARFVRQAPRVQRPPERVYINPPSDHSSQEQPNVPSLQQK